MSRPETENFAVVIPAFRSSETIATTMDAVLSQTHPPIVVIVVFDGPDAESEKIVAEHSLNADVIVLPENTGGPATPRNVGAASVRERGDVDAVWFLDDDDVPSPEFLVRMSDVLRAHPEAMLAGSSHEDWAGGSCRSVPDAAASKRSSAKRIELEWYLRNTGALLPSFSVVRVAALDLLDRHGGGFRPVLTNNQDYELFVRLIHLAECKWIDWSGGLYRIRPSSISSDSIRAWTCRERADLILSGWFDRRGRSKIGREFRRRSKSSARRIARERWHAGRRTSAAADLLARTFKELDFKATAVLARLICGFDRSPGCGDR